MLLETGKLSRYRRAIVEIARGAFGTCEIRTRTHPAHIWLLCLRFEFGAVMHQLRLIHYYWTAKRSQNSDDDADLASSSSFFTMFFVQFSQFYSVIRDAFEMAEKKNDKSSTHSDFPAGTETQL